MRPLPGFRDFYPAECFRRNHIFSAWRKVAVAHGFQEYDGPPLEPLELYTKKSGAEIVKQLYEFTDKGDRAVAMRPELTPTFARMVAAKHKDYRKPIKWFAIPQLFRYERQQKGRLREHFQFNADLAGTGTAAEDAEMIALLIGILRELGLSAEDCKVRLSSREVWTEYLNSIGVSEAQHAAVFSAVDKIEREPVESLAAKLAEAGCAASVMDKIQEFCSIRDLKQVPEGPAKDRLAEITEVLGAFGVGDSAVLDFKIVRGLAYYTGVVFEAFALDTHGKFVERAVAGGGRYDTLLQNLAGVQLPAAGFGMGDVVLGNLLEEKGLFPDSAAGKKVFVVRASDEFKVASLRLVAKLRQTGWVTDYPLRYQPLGKQFEAAENFGAKVAVICDAKLAEGKVDVKNLLTREQKEIALTALGEEITAALR